MQIEVNAKICKVFYEPIKSSKAAARSRQEGRQDLPQLFGLELRIYKDLGLSSKSQPDYLDEKATSLPIYLGFACQQHKETSLLTSISWVRPRKLKFHHTKVILKDTY